MSEFEPRNTPSDPLNPVNINPITPEIILPEESKGCFKAAVLRAAYDIPPADIPEDFDHVNLKDIKCPLVEADGSECTFADPMIFLRHNVGFTAMGSSNFCSLEGSSPREFKQAAVGNLAVRARRFGKAVSAAIRQKRSK